jgi:hypothetical protein
MALVQPCQRNQYDLRGCAAWMYTKSFARPSNSSIHGHARRRRSLSHKHAPGSLFSLSFGGGTATYKHKRTVTARERSKAAPGDKYTHTERKPFGQFALNARRQMRANSMLREGPGLRINYGAQNKDRGDEFDLTFLGWIWAGIVAQIRSGYKCLWQIHMSLQKYLALYIMQIKLSLTRSLASSFKLSQITITNIQTVPKLRFFASF